ncbi:hypothetical protein GX50_01872 [[Emmonsia] crescens]|uniref:Uncharacterized protein n=1 Tax=[Emmonsia] crescens TaxID=73230 RepID=A0A2B7ZQL1_9EURO|nr:hypothetical protein GX50_01872 [Emmonsia crescens]
MVTSEIGAGSMLGPESRLITVRSLLDHFTFGNSESLPLTGSTEGSSKETGSLSPHPTIRAYSEPCQSQYSAYPPDAGFARQDHIILAVPLRTESKSLCNILVPGAPSKRRQLKVLSLEDNVVISTWKYPGTQASRAEETPRNRSYFHAHN